MPSRELYRLATEFRGAKLWERLSDDELFAVKTPGGETGYVCVMGAEGEFLGLAVYPGGKGLSSYRRLAGIHGGMREAERFERMMGQDCVCCSFEDRRELGPRDLKEIRALGLTFKGKQAYPMYQRMRPRRVPWYVEDSADEAWLRLGLLAGLEVARRLEGQGLVQQDMFHEGRSGASKRELGFSEGASASREVPLLTLNAGGAFKWGAAALPPDAPEELPAPPLPDDLALKRLQKKPKRGAWECGVSLYPEPVAAGKAGADGHVAEPAEAPRFYYMMAIVDHESGLMLHFGMEAELGALAGAFAEGVEKLGAPREVCVRDERTRALLSGVAKRLGTRVIHSEALEFLDQAEDSLAHGPEQDPLAGLERSLDELLAAGSKAWIPGEMRRDLSEMLDKGILSGPVAEKARRLVSAATPDPAEKAAARKLLKAVGNMAADEKARSDKSRRAAERAAEETGSYIVSVSHGKGRYRHIRLPADATLFQLHQAILDAFGLTDDHAHAFFMDDKWWGGTFYDSIGLDRSFGDTKAVKLSDLNLAAGKPFKYLFDFGEERRFQCRVLKALSEPLDAPRVVRSAGEPLGSSGEAEKSIFPEEYGAAKLKRLYAALPLPPEAVKRILRYFDAFANLYGVIPLKKALEIYNAQNPPVEEAGFAALCEVARHDGKRMYSILGEDDLYTGAPAPADPLDREIIEESFLIEDDDYEELKQQQDGKPYYIPEKDALLRYADDGFYEKNAEFEAMRGFLAGRMKLPADRADDIADEMQLFAYMDEHDPDFLLDDLKRMGLKLTRQDDLKLFFERYVDLSNHTRKLVNRGYTPDELAKLSAPIARAPKVGRNAPCPCGSGKKYKECCGKKN